METLLSLAIALIAGLMLSRVAKLVKLPAVTAYLIAGVIIGPYCLGAIGVPGLGFTSMDALNDKNGILTGISNVALGFIAFAIGNEFRLSQIKKIGKQATVIGIFQAVAATIVVDIALVVVHLIAPKQFPVEAAIILGAVASATAPAATLMVVRQYKAKGPVTDTLLPVVAIDDAVGLIMFAISFGIAKALLDGGVSIVSIVVEPIIEIVGSIALGAIMGCLITFFERFFHSRSKRLSMSVAFVLLTVGITLIPNMHIGSVKIVFSPLLSCMMLGTIFCNLCDFSVFMCGRCTCWCDERTR